jgi:exosortase/archaeosortase family protein
MLTASGAWKHKLWYIPLGWGIIYGFNILRIYWISLIMQPHPELFLLFHNYLFKYLFYFVIFLMWVLWEQVIGGDSESRRTQTSKYQHKNQQL